MGKFASCHLFFFSKSTFLKKTHLFSMSNPLDQDHARRLVVPDLGPNSLQMLSAGDTSRQRIKF